MVEKGERLTKPMRCPDAVYRDMISCWSYHPSDRPTFAELLEHFTAEVNYENIKFHQLEIQASEPIDV